MRTLLNATLNFGMVYVPVGVVSSASKKDLRFRTLHVDCGTPIRKHDFCEQCDMSHPEVVKGWEIAKDTYIPIEQDELEAFSIGRDRLITLTKFVEANAIEVPLIRELYYLSPNERLHQPYEILARAMTEEKVAGVGKASLWGKEYPVAVVANDGVLNLLMLWCADEIKSDGEIAAVVNLDVPKEELGLAKQFIGMKRGKLDFGGDLTSESRQKALLYLEAKAQGAKLIEPDAEPEPEITISALDALRRSVAVK